MTLGLGLGSDSGDGGEELPGGSAGELPEGWARATLGELTEPISERYKPTSSDEFPYLGMDNVESHSGRIISFGIAREIKSSSPTVRPGYLLYGRLRPYLNKVTLANFTGICSGEFIVFPPTGALDSRFLLYRMLSPDFTHYVMEKNPTGDRPRAHWEQFSDFPILLPPLAEQRRIVAEIEQQIAHIEAGEAALQAAEDSLRIFFQATLNNALKGELTSDDLSEGDGSDLVPEETLLSDAPWTIPETWRWSKLGDLFKVSVGSTPSRGIPSHWNGDVPWVSSGEVSFNRITSTRESISRTSLTNAESRIHPPGTVMLAMIGEGKTRGQAAILDIKAAHNQNCASIRVSETKILPEYIYYTLVARYEDTRSSASGGNQPALNKAKVQAIPVPVPPLGTQRKIVQILESARGEVSAIGDILDSSREQAQELRAALLHAAFTGALTPQDPADEPASALLDRIRAERATARKAPRKRTTGKPRSSPPGQEELPQ